jgi:DNA-binding HxlR family transcriptional regulator
VPPPFHPRTAPVLQPVAFQAIRRDPALMRDEHRSLCPINLSLEIFGDAWTLLILRDMIFGGRRHFRELLQSQEGISSNILADRLHRLVDQGILTRSDDPTHKQKAIYSLTEAGIALVPVFATIGAWGSRYLPVSEDLSIRARLLDQGGPAMQESFMVELREEHLGVRPRLRAKPPGPSVAATLQAAYERLKRRRQSR